MKHLMCECVSSQCQYQGSYRGFVNNVQCYYSRCPNISKILVSSVNRRFHTDYSDTCDIDDIENAYDIYIFNLKCTFYLLSI